MPNEKSKFEFNEAQQQAENVLDAIISVLDNASVIAFSNEKKENQFSSADGKFDQAWESFVNDYLTVNPKLKNNETHHAFLQRHKFIFLEINNLRQLQITATGKINQLRLLIGKRRDELFLVLQNYYKEMQKTNGNSVAASIIAALAEFEEALAIIFPDKKIDAMQVSNQEKSYELEESSETLKLTKTGEPEEDKMFQSFLQRNSQVFEGIHDLINIKKLEQEKIYKVLNLLARKSWGKLFRIVATGFVKETRLEAEKDLVSMLTYLEEAGVIAFSGEKKHKFFAKDREADKGFKVFVETYLTANPRLKENETFHDFLQRHNLFFLEINQLKNTKILRSETIFELLYSLAENNLEKLFCMVFNRYITATNYLPEDQTLNINTKHSKQGGRTLVHAAARNNSVVILRELIKWGAELEITNWSMDENELLIATGGLTPLHEAAMFGSYDCMKILLSEGVNIDCVTGDFKQMPLHFAADKGFIKCVKLLVDSGAKLDRKNLDGKIPYELAKANKHTHCRHYLMVAMLDQKLIIPGNKLPKDVEAEAMELLTVSKPVRIPIEDVPLQHVFPTDVLAQIINFLDTTSIMQLRYRNHFFSTLTKESYVWENYVKEKLTASPQLVEGENFYGYLKRQKQLLVDYKNSKKIKFQTKTLFNYLCVIVKANWEKLFATVLKNYPEFDINFSEQEDEPTTKYLIHHVVAQDNLKMLEVLLSRKVGLTARTASLMMRTAGFSVGGEIGSWKADIGNNVLQEAVSYRAHRCIKKLLDYKHEFDINAVTLDSVKRTALHIAAIHGDLISVKLLVQSGARLDITDGDGDVPYKTAKEKGFDECAEYLAEKMQKKNIPLPKVSNCTIM